MAPTFFRLTQIIDQQKTENTNKYKNQETTQKRRRKKKGKGFSSFGSSVCSIINLSLILRLKEASVERNNVLCMEVSVLEKKKTQTVTSRFKTVSYV